MNTIKRPRRRPRVDSVNFRALGWLVTREAALRVIAPYAIGGPNESTARADLVSVPTETIQRRVRRWLNFRPDRRISP